MLGPPPHHAHDDQVRPLPLHGPRLQHAGGLLPDVVRPLGRQPHHLRLHVHQLPQNDAAVLQGQRLRKGVVLAVRAGHRQDGRRGGGAAAEEGELRLVRVQHADHEHEEVEAGQFHQCGRPEDEAERGTVDGRVKLVIGLDVFFMCSM